MKIKTGLLLLSFLIITVFISGCISFRSDLDPVEKRKNDEASLPKVSLFFHISHLEQDIGMDVVPKIINPRRGFRDIFGESMKEISNIKSFSTFTDNENDIDDVKRRLMRDSLQSSADFTLQMTVRKERSFAKHFLADILSYGTLTIFPVGYSWNYVITVDVFNQSQKQVKTYSQFSQVTSWNEMLFVFIYPFYPKEVKIEEVYLESMRNIFRQIENDGILKK